MSWWKSRGKSGHIDNRHKGPFPGLANAARGDHPELYYVGDGPADIMDEVIDRVAMLLEADNKKTVINAFRAVFMHRNDATPELVPNKSENEKLLKLLRRTKARVAAEYREEWKRNPYRQEYEALINFSLSNWEPHTIS